MASNFSKKRRSYGTTDDDTERLLESDSTSFTEPIESNGDKSNKDKVPGSGNSRWSELDDVQEKVKQCCLQTFTLQTLQKRLPIVKWLPKYRFEMLQSDVFAGLTVALTVIPQGLAYAQIAVLPAQYGLYTSFMGCFVYCLLGSTKDITMGPTAIMSLMTATFATNLSPVLENGERDPTLAIVLTFMTGIIQLAMGILNLGILVSFISHPVISAFTSAAAITIAFGQLKSFLGLKNISSDFVPMVYDTFSKLPETRIWDMTLGIVSLIIVLITKHLRTKKWKDDPGTTPSALVIICRKIIWLTGTGGNAIVVIGAAGVVAALESQGFDKALSVTGDIKPGMPPFAPPKFELRVGNTTEYAGEIFAKIGSGLGIVPLLSVVETVAIGKAFARINNYKIDPTQELLASGVANMMSSFVSSYPITGSFSRTAVNFQTGVKTQLGGVFTGGLVILALCVLTPWFSYIPKAALAAVIIAAVLQMVDYHLVPTLWRTNKWELLTFFITFICSLLIGIEYGILIGIGFSLLLLLYPIARPKLKFSVNQGTLVIVPLQGLNFPGAEYLEEEILDKALASGVLTNIVLNMEHLSDLDYTAIQSLKALKLDCSKNGMNLVLANGNPYVMDQLRYSSVKDFKICNSLQEALDEFSIQDPVIKQH